MRVFTCLSIFSLMLVTCQEKCFSDDLRQSVKYGEAVKQNTCLDRYDEETHPIGSSWSTARCFICECSRAGMRCCQRTRGTILVLRCEQENNTESYEDGKYRLDEKCRLIIPIYEDTGEPEKDEIEY